MRGGGDAAETGPENRRGKETVSSGDEVG